MFGSQARPGMRGTNSLGSLGEDTLGVRTYELEPLGDAQTYVLEPLGTATTDQFATFGQKAANVLIASVQGVPPGQRAAAMKRTMTKLDPTLPARAEKLALEARKRGMAPAAALHHGIASAMATGVVGELAKLGSSRRAPQSNSLLGLGCYRGRQAMGALGGTGTIVAPQYTAQPKAGGVNTFTSGSASTAADYVTCPGYSWDATVGAWTRSKVGQADVPGPPGSVCAVVQTGPQGGTTVTETNPTGKFLQVGPFTIPLGVDRYAFTFTGPGGVRTAVGAPGSGNTAMRVTPLPAEWQTFILKQLSTDCNNCIQSSMTDSSPGTAYGRLRDFFPGLPNQINHDFVSLRSGGPATMKLAGAPTAVTVPGYRDDGLPGQPIAVTTRPDNGETWGFYMYVQPADLSKVWDASTNPYVLHLEWREVNVGVWDWIKRIASTIVGAVVDLVGDLVCDLINKPGATTAAASTGPGGATVAAGIEIAKSQGLCRPAMPPVSCAGWSWTVNGWVRTPSGQVDVPGMGPCPTPTNDWILPVAIGAGALVLVLAISKSKRS